MTVNLKKHLNKKRNGLKMDGSQNKDKRRAMYKMKFKLKGVILKVGYFLSDLNSLAIPKNHLQWTCAMNF